MQIENLSMNSVHRLVSADLVKADTNMITWAGTLDNQEQVTIDIMFKARKTRFTSVHDLFKPYFKGRIGKKKLPAKDAENWLNRLILKRALLEKRVLYKDSFREM